MIPIAPACRARVAFEMKEQVPRETSAIAFVSEPAGSGFPTPFGSAPAAHSVRLTGWPLAFLIAPTSAIGFAVSAQEAGIGVALGWTGIGPGTEPAGASTVIACENTCVFETAATVIASFAVPGVPTEPRPYSARSLPAEMTTTTPASVTF